MATVILVRHGRSTANSTGVLAGRLPGVRLDEVGQGQARALAARLAPVGLLAAATSPLERCVETAQLALTGHSDALLLEEEAGLLECDYGEWSGRKITELAGEPLWRVVQEQPSHATFPGGESLQQMSARAVACVRRRDGEVEERHGAGAVWLAVTHGDIIKAVLADAYGMHLDAFQRVVADPASVSIVRYTSARPYVVSTNTHAGDLSWLAAPPEREDAVVGGGAGPDGPSPDQPPAP